MGGGANLGEGHGLVLILQVLVVSDLSLAGEQLFKSDQRHAFHIGGIEGEGQIDRAICGVGGEGGFGGNSVAGSIDSSLAGGLIHQSTLDGVLRAGDQIPISHGIDNRDLACSIEFLVVVRILQRSADAYNIDGLAFVRDILVGCDGFCLCIDQSLKRNKAQIVQAVAAVHGCVRSGNGERDIDSTVGGIGSKDGGGNDFFLISRGGADHFLAGVLAHENAVQGVGLAGNQILIGNGIDQGQRISTALNDMETILTYESRADLGNSNGLLLIIGVLMVADQPVVHVVQLFKGDQGLALEVGTVESEGQGNGAVCGRGNKGDGAGDGLACGINSSFAGSLVDQSTLDGVLIAGSDIGHFHDIDHSHFAGSKQFLAACIISSGGRDTGETNGLVIVLDIFVLCDFLAVLIGDDFKDDNGLAFQNGCGIRNPELQDNSTVLSGVMEVGGSGDGVAGRIPDRLASFLVHQSAGHRVGIISVGQDRQAVIADGILDDNRAVCQDLLIAVSIACGSADMRDLHGLVLVVDVLMLCNDSYAIGQLLEGNNSITGDHRGIEGKGNVNSAFHGLGGEGLGSSNGCAVRIHDSLAGCLVHQSTSNGILLADDNATISNGIDQGNGGVCGSGLSAILVLQGRADLGNGNGLFCVLQILMGSNDSGVASQLLESNQIHAAHGACVEVEHYINHAVAGSGLERGLCGNCDTVAVTGDLAGLVVHQAALQHIGHTGSQAVVGHLIDHDCLWTGNDFLFIVGTHCGSADASEVNGFVCVCGVVGYIQILIALRQSYESNNVLAFHAGGVEGELQTLCAGNHIGGESHGSGGNHGIQVVGCIQLAVQSVLSANGQPSKLDLINESRVLGSRCNLAVCILVRQISGEVSVSTVVINCSDIQNFRITIDRELKGNHGVVGVLRGQQLLHYISAIGEGIEAIHSRTLIQASAEPYAGVAVQQGFIDSAICGNSSIVGIVALLVGVNRAIKDTVHIGNDDVALPCFLIRHTERNVGEVFAGVAVHLHKAEFRTDQIVGEVRMNQYAVFCNENRHRSCGQPIAGIFREGCLRHNVATIGQRIGSSRSVAVCVGGQRSDDLALPTGLPTDFNGIVVVVYDGKGDASKGAATQGRGSVGLTVMLLNLDAATDDLIGLGIDIAEGNACIVVSFRNVQNNKTVYLSNGVATNVDDCTFGGVTSSGLGFLNGERANRQGRSSVCCFVKGIPRDFVFVIQTCSIFAIDIFGLNHPGASGITGKIVCGVLAGIILDSELGPSKGRNVAGYALCDLRDPNTGRVVLGVFLYAEVGIVAEIHRIHSGVQLIPLTCGDFLDVVGIQIQVRACVAAAIRSHCGDKVVASGIGIYAVDCTGQRIATVAIGHVRIHRGLIQVDICSPGILFDSQRFITVKVNRIHGCIQLIPGTGRNFLDVISTKLQLCTRTTAAICGQSRNQISTARVIIHAVGSTRQGVVGVAAGYGVVCRYLAERKNASGGSSVH